MLTREEALDLISDVEKFYCESADEYGYYCYEAESVIDKIYDSFEEAMKHKTCGECAAYDKDGNCKEGVRISNVQVVPSSFYCKWHEPKDNA